jgi:ribosomal protein S17E
VRNFIIVTIRELLDGYNQKFPDSKTFEEEKEVILQYFVFFERYI